MSGTDLTPVPAGYELASNYHQTRAHYSNDLTGRHKGARGRGGRALCDLSLQVYDDAEHAYWAAQWGTPQPASAASLPLCKRCARSAARLEAVAE